MPNSDTGDGVYNKLTKEIKYHLNYPAEGSDKPAGEDSTSYGAVITQSFGGNVETAKAHFFHADALTNNNTNGTQLDYAITADGNGIKFTIAFGTKGGDIAQADDWANTWLTTKNSLMAANKWIKPVFGQYWKAVDATPHLF